MWSHWGLELYHEFWGGHNPAHTLRHPNYSCVNVTILEKSYLQSQNQFFSVTLSPNLVSQFLLSIIPKQNSFTEILPSASTKVLLSGKFLVIQLLSFDCEKLRKLLIKFLGITLLAYMVSFS